MERYPQSSMFSFFIRRVCYFSWHVENGDYSLLWSLFCFVCVVSRPSHDIMVANSPLSPPFFLLYRITNKKKTNRCNQHCQKVDRKRPPCHCCHHQLPPGRSWCLSLLLYFFTTGQDHLGLAGPEDGPGVGPQKHPQLWREPTRDHVDGPFERRVVGGVPPDDLVDGPAVIQAGDYALEQKWWR